jgi:hypothetical protein
MQAKKGRTPRVQGPMILDVLPADIAPRLDRLPSSPAKKIFRSLQKLLRQRWIFVISAFVLLSVIAIIWHPWRSSGMKLPDAITKEISSFVPYYFQKLPDNLTVNTQTLSYSDGVLFFQVKASNGDEVVVSEQALPPAFSSNKPLGDEPVSNVDGVAFLSKREGRLIGTLVTDKKPQALVSLNAPETVKKDTVKTILQNFKPAE